MMYSRSSTSSSSFGMYILIFGSMNGGRGYGDGGGDRRHNKWASRGIAIKNRLEAAQMRKKKTFDGSFRSSHRARFSPCHANHQTGPLRQHRLAPPRSPSLRAKEAGEGERWQCHIQPDRPERMRYRRRPHPSYQNNVMPICIIAPLPTTTPRNESYAIRLFALVAMEQRENSSRPTFCC